MYSCTTLPYPYYNPQTSLGHPYYTPNTQDYTPTTPRMHLCYTPNAPLMTPLYSWSAPCSQGSSNWRKEEWEGAAEDVNIQFLETHSTISGLRGFRICWRGQTVCFYRTGVPAHPYWYSRLPWHDVTLSLSGAHGPTLVPSLIALLTVY